MYLLLTHSVDEEGFFLALKDRSASSLPLGHFGYLCDAITVPFYGNENNIQYPAMGGYC